jgi:hypothetical protein
VLAARAHAASHPSKHSLPGTPIRGHSWLLVRPGLGRIEWKAKDELEGESGSTAKPCNNKGKGELRSERWEGASRARER